MSLLFLLVYYSSWNQFQNQAKTFSTGQKSQIPDWIHYSVLYFGLLKVKILKNSLELAWPVNPLTSWETGESEGDLSSWLLFLRLCFQRQPEAYVHSLHGTTDQLNRTSNFTIFLMLISTHFLITCNKNEDLWKSKGMCNLLSLPQMYSYTQKNSIELQITSEVLQFPLLS